VGWVALGQGPLLWTNDNGVVWTNITPAVFGGHEAELFFQNIAMNGSDTIFFLDSAHGWMTSSTWDFQPPVPFFRTQDGGRTWTKLPFDRTSYGTHLNFALPVSVQFVDAEHGWFLWRHQTSSAFDFGALLSTSDGGETWTELPDPPSGGKMEFHTPQDGSMVAWARDEEDPAGEVLHTTHDGGRTWQRTSVPAPANCRNCSRAYGVPIFQNRNEGRLAATFEDTSTININRSVDVTYVTRDGGKSWELAETLEQPSPLGGSVSRIGTHEVRVFLRENHWCGFRR
jgi:photosystem II stability/assembly factor-like uncharacterized protein